MGTDLGDLVASDLTDAYEALSKTDAVLGPAVDGGFYLIGLNRLSPAAFAPEQWGSDDVYRRTEALLKGDGLRVAALHTRRDIDREEELTLLAGSPWFNSRLSVIIPTLQPLSALQERLERLAAQLWPDDEIIVVLPMGKDVEPISGAAANIPRTTVVTAPGVEECNCMPGRKQQPGTCCSFSMTTAGHRPISAISCAASLPRASTVWAVFCLPSARLRRPWS